MFWFISIIFLLGFIISLLYFIYYIICFNGNKYYRTINKNKYSSNHISGLTIVVPVKNEPLDLIEGILDNIYSWELDDIEVFIISMDPYSVYQKIRETTEKYKDNGLDVTVIWRGDWRGFKSGSLNIGLNLSTKKYYIVLDIDTRINGEELKNALKILEENPDIACVTGRWVGLNKDSHLSEALTVSQEYMFDILYRGRAGYNLHIYPLGSGTIYRTEVLRELGGWDLERLTDDLEIGCRLLGKGYRNIYLDWYRVGVEVPRKYFSLRIQQERWVYGAIDTLLSRFKYILRSPASWAVKIESIFYLLQYLPIITNYLSSLLLVPLLILYPVDIWKTYWYLGILWNIVAAFYASYFLESSEKITNDLWRRIVYLGRSAGYTLSLTPVLTKSFLRALLRKRMVFKRTPKGIYESYIEELKKLYPEIFSMLVFMTMSFYLLINHVVFTGAWFFVQALPYLYVLNKIYQGVRENNKKV